MIFIPIGLLVAAIVSFFKGNQQWKSGTVITKNPIDGTVTRTDSDKRMPWSSIGANIFGIIFLVLAIGSFVWMQLEK